MKLYAWHSKALAAFALCAMACAAAVAQDAAPERDVPLYQVEIIVFAHRNFDPNEEYFDQTRLPPPRPAAVPQRRQPFVYEDLDLESLLQSEPREESEPTQPPAAPASLDPPPFGFRVLQPEELELRGAYAALARQSAYEPLLHAGWVQEGLPEQQARAFDLNELGRFNPSGTVLLHVSRFLHLRVNLLYQAGQAHAGASSPGQGRFELSEVALPPRYSLVEDRRVTRTGEMHYFDHPAFGVIVTIRPQARQAQQPADGVPRPAA